MNRSRADGIRRRLALVGVLGIMAGLALMLTVTLSNNASAQQSGGGPPSPPPGAIGDALASIEAKLDELAGTVDGQGTNLAELEQELSSQHDAILSSLLTAGRVEPFQARGNCTFAAEESVCDIRIGVPAGKLWVIEHVAVSIQSSDEEENIAVALDNRAGGEFGRYGLGTFAVADLHSPVGGTQALSVPLRLYGDPGSGVLLIAFSDREDTHSQVFFNVSGHLLDAPELGD